MNTIKLNTIGEVVNKVESGGGGSGSGSDWHYYNISSLSAELQRNTIGSFAMLIKQANGYIIGGGALYAQGDNVCLACAIDFNTKVKYPELSTMASLLNMPVDSTGSTMLDFLFSMGVTEITEEQFYTL